MTERNVVPREVILGKILDRTLAEIHESEGFRVYQEGGGQVYDIGVERRARRKEKPFPEPDNVA